MEVGSMSNNLPHKVRKKATMTEDIQTQVECKCELKDDTINLYQKIIVEQFYLSRGFEDTTLSPDKFTRVSEKFIQVLNVSNKHWILVFRRQFGQINICNSLVTEKIPPIKLLKVYLASETVTGLFLNCVFFQFSGKKILLIVEYFAIAHAIKTLHGENVEKSSFDVTLMRDHLLVCLQLQILSPFPNTNKRVYRCRSVCLFFDVYCICREAYFHDNVKSDDRYFMANCNNCGEW